MSSRGNWLITGSSRGIGLEFTRQLLLDPDTVVFAACRSPDTATKLHELKENEETKGTLHIVALDVEKEDTIKNAASAVKSILGEQAALDYLVNNAALGSIDDTPLTLKAEPFLKIMEVNVVGPSLVLQHFIPFLENSTRPVVLNLTSGMGSIGLKCHGGATSYSISKTALNMLTYKLTKAKPQIIAMVMDPGWVKTDMGGPDAKIDVDYAVGEMLKIVIPVTSADSGTFRRYDGAVLPW